MTPEDEFNQQVNKMYDRLVRLGYAHPTVSDYSTKEINWCFTDSGLRLRREMLAIFGLDDTDSLKNIKPDEFIALFTVFASFPD
jgi:hypothetical protein